MQLIFFVPPNEELEGTLHPQKFGCTPKNEGKRVHVPPDEKTCGHAVIGTDYTSSCKYNYHMIMTMMGPFLICGKITNSFYFDTWYMWFSYNWSSQLK